MIRISGEPDQGFDPLASRISPEIPGCVLCWCGFALEWSWRDVRVVSGPM